MGTTFVGIGDHGFWMRDSILEIWLRFLALHIEDPVESGSLATEIRDQKLVRSAIHSLLNALKKAPNHLSNGVLNLMGFNDGEFTQDLETWRLVEIGQAYLDLLDGKIQTRSSDSFFMPGSREQKNI
jgi:hypothetical protein